MRNEAYFAPHCDDENCCLGTFEYECPCCQKNVTDTSMWWKQDDMYNAAQTFSCDNCSETLEAGWDKKECEYYVKQAET